MRGRLLSSRWWCGLFAAALLLGILAPPRPAGPAAAWLGAAICHAPGSAAPDQPAGDAPSHIHCGLCQIATAADLPPAPQRLEPPGLAYAAFAPARSATWPGPGAHRSYASRAPPPIG